MYFKLTEPQAALQREATAWLKEVLPPGWRGSGAPIADSDWEFSQEFNRKLAAKGWVAPGWPKDAGGMGLGWLEQLLLHEVFSYHYAPGGGRGQGVHMIGPLIYQYGTEDQKRQHIAGIVDATSHWAQGYSEPGSGSDLASLATRADRDGDEYVINGSKIWSSNAQYAEWAYVLARTDQSAPKHRGISVFLVPTSSPGFSISPLTNMAGDSDFNQMFFDNVRIPVTNRLGEENRGWYMAVELLDHERASFGDTGQYRRQLDDLRPYLPGAGASDIGDVMRARYADLYSTLEAARWLGYRAAWKADRGEEFSNESSATKIMTSELAQRIGDFGTRYFGLLGIQREDSPRFAADGLFPKRLMWSTAQSIYSGTNEIQRGIIATRGLGLPRS